MSQSKPKLTKAQFKEYDRLMLRSAFVSLFWSVITDLKARRRYKLQQLADKVAVDKSSVSRWFSGSTPNWTLNTISDIANALNVDLKVEAVDRATGAVHTSQGKLAQGEQRGLEGPKQILQTIEESAIVDIHHVTANVSVAIDRPTTEQFEHAH